ncbi:hypothetical protein HMSSN036_72330 [Paenibacillus macerans]|nr:hypothetical protein HMSSN036_72330 [Paenibacillus macerans]
MIVLIIVAAVLVLIAVSFGLLVFYAKRKDERKTEADVLQFLAAHPELASMYVMENDRVLIDYQSDVKRPLASVLKIILAIELAEQAAEGRIDMNEAVPLDSLRRFYIPGTDGGAHPSWLDALDPAVTADGTVSLMEAAKGMIHYSSNANTEYFMERLGLDNINARIQKLALSRHDPIFPVSSAMLMYGYMTKYEHMSHRQAEQAMKGLTDQEYAAKAQLISIGSGKPGVDSVAARPQYPYTGSADLVLQTAGRHGQRICRPAAKHPERRTAFPGSGPDRQGDHGT